MEKRIRRLEERMDAREIDGVMTHFMLGTAKSMGAEANFWDVLEAALDYAEEKNPGWAKERA